MQMRSILSLSRCASSLRLSAMKRLRLYAILFLVIAVSSIQYLLWLGRRSSRPATVRPSYHVMSRK